MAEVSTIGLDIAQQVFQAHGADALGHVVFRKKVTRAKLIEFFASQLKLTRFGGAFHALAGGFVDAQDTPAVFV